MKKVCLFCTLFLCNKGILLCNGIRKAEILQITQICTKVEKFVKNASYSESYPHKKTEKGGKTEAF